MAVWCSVANGFGVILCFRDLVAIFVCGSRFLTTKCTKKAQSAQRKAGGSDWQRRCLQQAAPNNE
jgi:hypothetical protein